MPSLEEINEEFLLGAAERRYSHMSRGNEVWSKKFPYRGTPHKISYYRSIKYAPEDMNCYMFVLDLDGPTFTQRSLEAAIMLRRAFYNTLKVEPLLKASGMKGVQLIADMSFPRNFGEKRCLLGMAQTAYSVWHRSTARRRLRVGFGLKLPKIYVDACMFRQGRLVRSFCKHLGSGLYSVPFKHSDSFKTVKRRMKLQWDPIWPDICQVNYNDIKDGLLDYEDTYYFEVQGPDKATLERLDNTKVKRGKRGRYDRVYKRLTPRLRKIADMNTDIKHEWKWPLVCYMYCELEMSREDIINWIWKHCRWHDLNNLSKTAYQVNHSCKWCDKLYDNGSNPMETRTLRWVYD